MSKRKAPNSLLTIDQGKNDTNTWYNDKDCDRDEVENDLDDLCGKLDEENKNNSDPTEELIFEDDVIENTDHAEKEPLNPKQRYVPRKHLNRNHKIHDIESSSYESNFEKVIYLNRKGKFEEYVGCLDQKNDKKSQKGFLE